jgi:sialate O-acetylesterase
MKTQSLGIALIMLYASPAYAEPRFDEIFQDNSVLQAERPLTLWGMADPNEAITIEWQEQRYPARANAKGEWTAVLAPLPAGQKGSLTLSSEKGVAQRLNAIVTGDVFLCSGQSNMEMPVRQVQNGEGELSDAAYPDIRLLHIAHGSASTPQSDFKTRPIWSPATKETVSGFSAACFFMGRELHISKKRPIGLIHASWGGTAIDTWRSLASLTADLASSADMALLTQYAANPALANRVWGNRWAVFWKGISNDTPWTASLKGASPVPVLTNWEKWDVEPLKNYDGQMWLQAEFTLTKNDLKAAKAFELSMIDDLDQSWVNGIGIGTTFGHWVNRSYPVGSNVLKPGVNRLTIHVTDLWAQAGGLVGDTDGIGLRLSDGRLIALQNWVYKVEPNTKTPPHAPWTTHWGKSVAGNAMIAPVMPYTLRGVAWYQGESDTDLKPAYRDRLAGLMKDWRTGFKNPDMPFLIVQLSDFGAASSLPVNSNWAALREEQRQAVLNDKNAALIITRDLGDKRDVHPTNKKTVGLRLARAARAVVYGEGIAPSGPAVQSARIIGNTVRISTTGTSNRLRAFSSPFAIGFELCSDAPAQCSYAPADIQGDEVVIKLPSGTPPTRVRYCWADSSYCNVADEKDDPLGPFEVTIER